ncbi:MAG: hypothetical protein ACFCAD_23785, partial [Pleurocapsa sp.]
GVGEPYFDIRYHVVNVEGNSLISGFVPTEDNLFEVESAVVEVTDGKLTIDAIGGENTKLNFVEIASANDSEIVDNPVEVTPIEVPDSVDDGGLVPTIQPIEGGININFGAPTVSSPSGFIQDIGEAYNEEQGYGWVTEESAGSDNPEPLELIANGRDRNVLIEDETGESFREPVLDSLIHMQYPEGLGYSNVSETTAAAWEYDIANGEYEVTVGVGDPDFFDSTHAINVEGESLIFGFEPTPSENNILSINNEVFASETATVEVNDGKLTIDAIGGENTKINYINIVLVDSEADIV